MTTFVVHAIIQDFSEDQAVATAKILALTGLEVLGDETRKGYQCDMIDEDLKGS